MTREEKFEIARLGVYTEQLKGNPAVQVLLERMQRRAEAARELLTEHDPDDAKGIRALQDEVKRFKALVEEMHSMIVEGHICEQVLREEGGEA